MVESASNIRRWQVRDPYQPFNLRKVPYYTILDTERGVRGPDDRIFCSGYEDDSDIADRMRELIAGDIEVSRRRSVESRIVAVLPSADPHTNGPRNAT